MSGTVIIGAGQAGAQLALSLRECGDTRPITLVGDETRAPYQRPPLSKEYLAGRAQEKDLSFRGDDVYEREGIRLITGVRATAVRPRAHTLELSNGEVLEYGNLVFATGARNLQLDWTDAVPRNVHTLRTFEDAERLRTALKSVKRAVVVGAGYIGLEFATIAAELGVEVTVLVRGQRILRRSVSPELSEYLQQRHAEMGVSIRRFSSMDGFIRDAEGSVEAVIVDGAPLPADLVLVGIGVLPNVELAAEAGLEVDGGILVDAGLQTSEPGIFAIGDCASSRIGGGPAIRLESVQNAAEQARFLARRLTGAEGEYSAVPWFWSHQAGVKLQIAGFAVDADESIVIGDVLTNRFSIARFAADELVAVESVNNAPDHLAARRILAARPLPTKDEVRQPDFSLKEASKAKNHA